jgi:hypothetical protein
MKKLLLLLIASLVFQYAPAQSKNDEEAIKKVLIAETDHFNNRNFEAWSNSFVHQPYLLWTVTNGFDPGDVLTIRGWDAFKDFMKGWFESAAAVQDAKEAPQNTTTRDQWQIQIRDKVAWVTYNQQYKTKDQLLESTETRVMENINGVWKVAMQSTLADFKDAKPPIRSRY